VLGVACADACLWRLGEDSRCRDRTRLVETALVSTNFLKRGRCCNRHSSRCLKRLSTSAPQEAHRHSSRFSRAPEHERNSGRTSGVSPGPENCLLKHPGTSGRTPETSPTCELSAQTSEQERSRRRGFIDAGIPLLERWSQPRETHPPEDRLVKHPNTLAASAAPHGVSSTLGWLVQTVVMPQETPGSENRLLQIRERESNSGRASGSSPRREPFAQIADHGEIPGLRPLVPGC
jgi:hypothetical protein